MLEFVLYMSQLVLSKIVPMIIGWEKTVMTQIRAIQGMIVVKIIQPCLTTLKVNFGRVPFDQPLVKEITN